MIHRVPASERETCKRSTESLFFKNKSISKKDCLNYSKMPFLGLFQGQLSKIKKFFFKTVNQLAGAGAPFFFRSSGQAWFVREDTTVLAVLPCIVALPCEHVPF